MSKRRAPTDDQPSGDNSDTMLRADVQRLMDLDNEIAEANRAKADVYASAKARGENPAHIRAAIRYHKDPEASEARDEGRDAILRRAGLKT